MVGLPSYEGELLPLHHGGRGGGGGGGGGGRLKRGTLI